jgi:S-(hydroxymethyl)glutathione dehydrogenase/alcohol dehydrogenase
VYAAGVEPGDYVAVVGIGGIGSNAVQGAAMAGARVVAAIDPIAFKREKAMEFGATHTFSSMEEAMGAMGDTTWDRGYDKVIMTMGTGDGETLGEAFNLGGKRAKIVVTNLHSTAEGTMNIPGIMLTMFEKQLIGSLFGSANIRKDIPQLFELYLAGQLKLDELITKTYTLDQINEGYEAMRAGENIRGIIVYD